MQNLIEGLRPLVGLKGWDYCVLWKLSEDQRFLEWVDCCCSGSDENTQINEGQELQFPVYPVLPCRDTMQHYSRTNSCDLLSQLPSSLPLDSGIYAQTLISNQLNWLNSSSNRDSRPMVERDGTRVLVPFAGGLIELFVSKDVSEDQQVINFITAQCNISQEQDTLISASNTFTNTSYNVNINEMSSEIRPKPFYEANDDLINHFEPPPFSPAMSLDHHDSNLPYDISVDRIRLCSSSPMNFLQHVTHSSENRMKNINNSVDYYDQSLEEMGLQDAAQKSMVSDMHVMQALENMEKQGDQDSVKQEGGRADTISDYSDQIDDDGDTNYRKKTGKRHQSKNLVAERNRRKKLNEGLYRLRALVPFISKMDKASILGDAIKFVKDLQKQVKELQDELEQHSNDEKGGAKRTANNISGNHNNFQSDMLSQDGTFIVTKPENDKPPNGFHMGTPAGNGSITKQNQDSDSTGDKGQQMEPQVGVTQLDGNEFFVTVLCEHKPGGFVRLMEALDTLGLKVTNANVTSFRSLVSNVFKVEKKETEIVQADDVRDSLLEITKNSSKGVGEMAKTSENDTTALDYHHNRHYHHHLHNYHSPNSYLQHLYN